MTRRPRDFYETAPFMTRGLLVHVPEIGGRILECCAGEREFTITGASEGAQIRLSGGTQGPIVNIAQHRCILRARLNEGVTVPFATVTFSSIPANLENVSRPRLPWPQIVPSLTLEDALVPGGWQYSFACCVEKSQVRVVIPQTSKSVRNIAFLGSDEELVIVAPARTIELTWSAAEDVPDIAIPARILWRSRRDSTRG